MNSAAQLFPQAILTLGRLFPVGLLALLLLGNPLPVRAQSPRQESAAPTVPAAIKVLILSGRGDHNWAATTPLLRQMLMAAGRFEVRVNESSQGLTAEALAPFDVVVQDHTVTDLGSATALAINSFVNEGKGLVVVHGAFQGMPTIPAITAIHAPFGVLQIHLDQPQHPIVQGLNGPIRTADEPLFGFKLNPGDELIASTVEASPKEGKKQPLLFVSRQGRGRVFCSALGHDTAAMMEKVFVTTLVRGTEWAGSGKVTLPAEITLFPTKPGPARVLVVTGGHDHDVSFYSLFQGRRELGFVPVSDSTLAFKEDLSSKYDVLVFYDFTRDLNETARKNLRQFVESGKGIVVLHHAILNFQKWTWWSEEVVGGRYRLQSENGIPNSTVKWGQEHLVSVAVPHPVTAGIRPFHVGDEMYQGLYLSPRITPLLTTDNSDSDKALAWIGPCETSRVVFIQLGHGPVALQHPAYRTLVHNAILWSAGKTQ